MSNTDALAPGAFRGRILAIDDDPDCLVLLRTILTHARYELLPLLKSDRLVETVRDERPDLVITDMMMPGMMGGGVYAAVRATAPAGLPVIVSTSGNMRVRGGDTDPMLAYVPKPVDASVLLATVERLLSAAPPAPATAGQRPASH